MCPSGIGKPPRGAALVVTMLVMAVLLLAGTTFMTISSTESQIALNERAAIQALHLAEAGLFRAIAKLNNPTGYPSYSGETNSSLGAGTVTITVANSSTQPCTGSTARDITAIGKVSVRGTYVQGQVQASVDRVAIPFRYGLFSTVPNTIVQSGTSAFFGSNNADRTEKELWIGDDGDVDSFDSAAGQYNATTNRSTLARIGGNSDVRLDNRVDVSGVVRAGDSIGKGSNVTVSGGEVANLGSAATSPGDQFPLVAPPTGLSCSSALSLYTANWVISPGTYCWTSMTIAENSTLQPTTSGLVTIYLTGNLTIGNNVRVGNHPNTNMRFIMKSNAPLSSTASGDQAVVDAGSTFRFYGGLYGRNTNVRIGSDSQIYGSIIGRTVVFGSGARIHHDLAMLRSEICGALPFDPVNPVGPPGPLADPGKRQPRSGYYAYAVRSGTWREYIP